MNKKLLLAGILLLSIKCIGLYAQTKIRYTQNYLYRKQKDGMYTQNRYTFKCKIRGDFSSFNEDSDVAIILGNTDILHNFGSEDNLTGFSTLKEALSLGEEGYAKIRLQPDKGKGRIYAFAKKTVTVKEKERIVYPIRVWMNWNSKRLTVTIRFREGFSEDNEPVIDSYPYDLSSLSQWDGSPFSVDMQPISIVFNGKIFKAKNLKLEGRVLFNTNGEVKKASAKLKNVYLTERIGAKLTMEVSPDDEDNPGGTVTPKWNRLVAIGDPIPITATPSDKFTFSSWSVSGNATVADASSSETTVTLSGDSTITANFTETILKLQVSPTGAGTTSPTADISNSVNTGEAQAIQATPAEHYNFDHWEVSGDAEIENTNESSTTVTVNSGTAVVTAVFSHETANLTMDVTPDNTGTTDPEIGSHTVNTLEYVVIKATPASGYKFSKWTLSGNGTITNDTLAETTVYLTGDSTVTAEFEVDTGTSTLTMDVSPSSAAGTTNPGEGTHSVATNIAQNITATPASGYHFVKWTVSGDAVIASEKSSSTTVTLSGNATVTAIFEADTGTATLSLAVSPSGSGTLNPGEGTHTVDKGEPQKIEAYPATGYKFSKWTITGSGSIDDTSSSTTFVTLDGDATVTAEFTAE